MTEPSSSVQSPQWGRTAKLIVVLVALAIVGLLAWQFSALIGQFIVAAMLAYILNPLVEWITTHARLSRGWAVLIVYVLMLLAGMGVSALIGVAAFQQGSALFSRLPGLIGDVGQFLSDIRTNPANEITIGPFHIALARLDWQGIETQVGEMLRPMLGQGTQVAGQVAQGTVNVLGWLAITLIISIYVAIDLPRIGAQLADLARQSGYRHDFDRLARGFNRIWNAYLRGQLILGLIIAVITSLMLLALGVENWLALGLLSGVLQVIPYVGPTVSAVLIVLFALFQPGNYLGLANWQYGLLVFIVTMVVQQVSGNLLLPTVVGDALNMSALAVLISLIVGFAVAGVFGVILAAPVAASLKLLVNYVWRKLLDLPPFPEQEPASTHISQVFLRTKAFMQQIRNRRTPG